MRVLTVVIQLQKLINKVFTFQEPKEKQLKTVQLGEADNENFLYSEFLLILNPDLKLF